MFVCSSITLAGIFKHSTAYTKLGYCWCSHLYNKIYPNILTALCNCNRKTALIIEMNTYPHAVMAHTVIALAESTPPTPALRLHLISLLCILVCCHLLLEHCVEDCSVLCVYTVLYCTVCIVYSEM